MFFNFKWIRNKFLIVIPTYVSKFEIGVLFLIVINFFHIIIYGIVTNTQSSNANSKVRSGATHYFALY